jgi:hypothetical protein
MAMTNRRNNAAGYITMAREHRIGRVAEHGGCETTVKAC